MKDINETMQFRPTRALIDLTALRHNFQLARELSGAGRPLMAIIKANAYGHGAVQAGRAL
jgi:alanine racemase